MTISLVLLAISALSLWQRGLELGIDFEGGVAWDVPADQLTVDDARDVLEDAGIPADQAKIQERTSDSGNIIKVQVGDQTEAVRVQLQEAFATAAGVDAADVSVASVSATWGEEITRKALLALVVFLFLIAIYISFRFEWRMAVTALLAMFHDVAISVGIYSVFGFDVTPATVVAFLTVLGYSLYDSIVVFDRIRDNEKRVAAAGLTAGDLINISMNQVLLRSINTTLASSLPVLSLLLIGAGLFGQVTLREFAIALLVGMLTGAYSSLFVASPMLGWLKARSPAFAGRHTGGGDHLVGRRPAGRRHRRARRGPGHLRPPPPGHGDRRRGAPTAERRRPRRRPPPSRRRPWRPSPPNACSPTRPGPARRRSADRLRAAAVDSAERQRPVVVERRSELTGRSPPASVTSVHDRGFDGDAGEHDGRRRRRPVAALAGPRGPRLPRRRASRSGTSRRCSATPPPSGGPSTSWPPASATSRSTGSSASSRGGSSSPRPSPTTSAPRSSRCASPASCRGRWCARSTSWSTAPTSWRSTATPSTPTSGSW